MGKRTTYIIDRLYRAELQKKKRKGLWGWVMPKTTSIQVIESGLDPRRQHLKSMKIRFFSLIFVAAFIIHAFFIYYYNVFYRMYFDVVAAESVVDNMLQKRHNIALNLSKMVLTYSQHEKKIFDNVLASRQQARDETPASDAVKDLLAKSGDPSLLDKSKMGLMSGALTGKLVALAEQYPNLKLSQNIQSFIDAQVSTEKELAVARNAYNKLVNDYTTTLIIFPGNIANLFYRFKPRDFFKASESAKKFQVVSF